MDQTSTTDTLQQPLMPERKPRCGLPQQSLQLKIAIALREVFARSAKPTWKTIVKVFQKHGLRPLTPAAAYGAALLRGDMIWHTGSTVVCAQDDCGLPVALHEANPCVFTREEREKFIHNLVVKPPSHEGCVELVSHFQVICTPTTLATALLQPSELRCACGKTLAMHENKVVPHRNTTCCFIFWLLSLVHVVWAVVGTLVLMKLVEDTDTHAPPVGDNATAANHTSAVGEVAAGTPDSRDVSRLLTTVASVAVAGLCTFLLLGLRYCMNHEPHTAVVHQSSAVLTVLMTVASTAVMVLTFRDHADWSLSVVGGMLAPVGLSQHRVLWYVLARKNSSGHQLTTSDIEVLKRIPDRRLPVSEIFCGVVLRGALCVFCIMVVRGLQHWLAIAIPCPVFWLFDAAVSFAAARDTWRWHGKAQSGEQNNFERFCATPDSKDKRADKHDVERVVSTPGLKDKHKTTGASLADL